MNVNRMRTSYEVRRLRATTVNGSQQCALPQTDHYHGQFVDVHNGESFMKAPLVKGNHIDALPYWSEQLTLSNPSFPLKGIAYAGFSMPRVCKPMYPDATGNDVYIWDTDFVATRNFALSTYVPSFPFSSADKQWVRNVAETRARAALRRGLMQMPLLLRERMQTLAMAKERVGDLMRVARSVQNRDLREWKRLKSAKSRRAFAQKAASSHLELIFGWLPLLAEVEGMCEFIQQDDLSFRIGKGRMTQSKATSSAAWHGAGNSLAPNVVRSLRRTRHTYSVRTSLRVDVNIQLMSQLSQLGFNPLYTLYDFTPLSFVSGWFSNFNHWIQAIDPLFGATYRTGSSSIRSKTSITQESYVMDPRFQGKPHVAKLERIRDDRVVLSTEPDPTFTFYNNLGVYSVLAGTSLYLQRRLKPLEKALKVKQFRYKSKKAINLPPITYRTSQDDQYNRS